MSSLRSRTFAVGYLTVALLGSAVWLTNLRHPAALADGRINTKSHTRPNESQPIAVIELFTSEGCSSCPSADDNLRRIENAAAKLDQKVFPLSFHVDYWNRLGWKDPFSQAEFSERQREYAAILDSDTYTPQMIVNGISEFVGSDRRRSDLAIRKALEAPAKHAITLSAAESDDPKRLSFRYQVTGPVSTAHERSGDVLNIAVATDLESVAVSRGENGGRKLSHVWVVKSFQVIPLSSKEATFDIDQTVVKKKHSRVIAYIQSHSTGEITGACALGL